MHNMYFINSTTQAVTETDIELHHSVCIALKSLCLIGSRLQKRNRNWTLLSVDCHAVARLMALSHPELTLVDGIIVGLRIQTGTGDATAVETDHSWLRTPNGAIIDPYPMGIISTTGALLIPTAGTKYTAHGGNLYLENAGVRTRFSPEQSWKTARSCQRTLRKNISKELVHEVCDSLL